ncbi:MAG: hypothetical protein AB1938_20240 [Myxococcota bacterium]
MPAEDGGCAAVDAGPDPDDAPWLGDTSPFDPTEVDCLDLDAGLGCGLLTPKQLEAVCHSPRASWEAEALAIEALDEVVADDVTYERVVRELALLRRFDPSLEDVWQFQYLIYPTDTWYPPDLFLDIRDGAHPGFNCLVASLPLEEFYFFTGSSMTRLYFRPRLNLDAVQHFIYQHTPASRSGWASSPYHPCNPDICLVIERSRFVYIVKDGDCRAPRTRTYVVGLDGGVTTTGAWDQQRYPSCRRWFDQIRWLP